MKNLKKLLTLSSLLFIVQLSNASVRILGGEIQYSYIDSNQYILELVVYKDCNSDTFGASTLYGISGADTLSWNLFAPDSGKDLTGLGTNCGIRSACQGGFPYGMMEFRYRVPVDLRGKGNCSWLFYWEYGKRSNYLNSGMANQEFAIQAELNACLQNNSLRFNSLPRFFYCQNEFEFIDFSLSANNEIDSVSYVYAPAWQGLKDPVAYNSGLSFNRPISMMIQSWVSDGILRFRGSRVNDAAPFKVQARAWRRNSNGTMELMGSVYRDVEFRVTACGGNNQPGVQATTSGPNTKKVCPGDTLEWEVESFDADILDSTFLYVSTSREEIQFLTTNGTELKARGTIRWIVPNEPDMFQGQPSRIFDVAVHVRDNGCDLQRWNTVVFSIEVGFAGTPPIYQAGPDLHFQGSSTPIIPQGYDSLSSPAIRAFWSAVGTGLGSFDDPLATRPRFTLTNQGQRYCEYYLVRNTVINNQCLVFRYSDTMRVTRDLDSFDAGSTESLVFIGSSSILLDPPLGSYVHAYQWNTNGSGSFDNRFFPKTNYYTSQTDINTCDLWFWLTRDIVPGCGQTVDSLLFKVSHLPPTVYFRSFERQNGKAKAIRFIAEHPLLKDGAEVKVIFNDTLNGQQKTVPLNTLFSYELTAQDAQRGNVRVYAQVDRPCESPLEFQLEVRLDTVNITSVEAPGPNRFKVYPNPASRTLAIQSDERLTEVLVMDLQGRVLFKSKHNFLDVAELAPGTYILRIRSENGSTAMVRWQKH